VCGKECGRQRDDPVRDDRALDQVFESAADIDAFRSERDRVQRDLVVFALAERFLERLEAKAGYLGVVELEGAYARADQLVGRLLTQQVTRRDDGIVTTEGSCCIGSHPDDGTVQFHRLGSAVWGRQG
jgi:hypothetical protein